MLWSPETWPVLCRNLLTCSFETSINVQMTLLNLLTSTLLQTFFAIGYGDLQVETYCGRSLAVLTGIVVSAGSRGCAGLFGRYCCLYTISTCLI